VTISTIKRMSKLNNMFEAKGRYIIVLWVMPLFYFPGLDYIYRFIGDSAAEYWYELGYYFYFQFLLLFLLIGQIWWNKVDWKKMLTWPVREDLPPAIELTAFTYVFSILAAYVVFMPLSYIVPEFVKVWFIDTPSVVYSDGNNYPVIPNVLSVISLVVLAPLTEELAFRGILLHRWAEKWGLLKAILVSSFFFGLMHSDPVGAAAFGIAMSYIYLKTQTLIVPMLCHALYNFVVWLLNIYYERELGSNSIYTIQEFRDEWAWGILSAIIVFLWVYKYVRSENTTGALKLPSL